MALTCNLKICALFVKFDIVVNFLKGSFLIPFCIHIHIYSILTCLSMHMYICKNFLSDFQGPKKAASPAETNPSLTDHPSHHDPTMDEITQVK